jgi:hypothetical protein
LIRVDAHLSDATYSEQLTIRETKDILTIIQRLAVKEGQQVGVFIRTGFRTYLRDRDDLTEQERRILGLNGH